MKWSRIIELIEEPEGKLSAQSVGYLAVCLVTLIVWSTICIQTRTMVDIPMGVGVFVGVIVTGKTVQRGTAAYYDGRITGRKGSDSDQ